MNNSVTACRPSVVSVFFAVLAVAAVSVSAQVPQALDASRYERAEKFLAWNKSRLVLNGDIQHHWIADKDSFWYRHEKPEAQVEFRIVDAVSLCVFAGLPDQRQIAFDAGYLFRSSCKWKTEIPETTKQIKHRIATFKMKQINRKLHHALVDISVDL